MADQGPLIVPVKVQALVVNDKSMNFLRAGMNYGQLANFQSASPAPFMSETVDFATQTANQGVYLMWTLPEGLRHGTQLPDGSFSFKAVPNRWMVIRLLRPAAAGATPPAATAWMVQSDYLSSDDGKSAFLDPRGATISPTSIGRKVAITTSAPWQEPAPGGSYFLKAVAESNPAFAAYQPFNENVFSLFDNLATQNVADGTLSYFVLGWYSDPSADALAAWQAGVRKKDFADVLAELGWSATGYPASSDGAVSTQQGDKPTARTSLYHGGAFAVPWAPAGPAPASPKDDVVPQVAVGNTSVDAVVAFVRAAFASGKASGNLTPQQAADLLEAFQYNMLPALTATGGEKMLEQQIRSQWFGSSQIGTRWAIVDTQLQPGTPKPDPPNAAELAKETAWLDALNSAQREFDVTTRDLIATQRQLFEMWWKSSVGYLVSIELDSYPWNTSQQQFQAALDSLAATTRTLKQQLNAKATGATPQIPVATTTTKLDAAIANFATAKGLPPTRTLKAIADARFWAPADPVLVISNTAHTLKIDPDSVLTCRWPGELVTSITVGADGKTFTAGTSQLAPSLPAVNWTNLPARGAALFAEFFLLDPANAALIAAAAGSQLSAAQIATLASSMSPPQVTGSGLAPGIVAPYPWAQPWQPIYLDWMIDWFAVPFQQSNGTPNWTFNGLDYDLVPQFAKPSAAPPITGRSILTPKPSFEFKARVDQFVHDYPDSDAASQLKAISDLVQTVDAWDFLSQSLGGMGTWIAGRNAISSQNPDPTPLAQGDSLASLIGDEARVPPYPSTSSVDGGRDPETVPPSSFEGMRGGQFAIRRLTVIDAFGQTLEIVRAPVEPDQFPRTSPSQGNLVFHPLPSDGLAPTGSGTQSAVTVDPVEPLRFLQVPPRLLQPARLNFQFMPQANGNPILGWLLPNHIDSGVAVYKADGTAYGELRLGVDPQSGAPVVVWDAAPGNPDTMPAPSANLPDLDNFLATLQGFGAGALGDFLRAVDETLWTIDPLGGRSDTFLSVLVGRPLAVVAAALSFELQHEACRDTDWPYTFADPVPDPLFVGYKFPVRLGDLGYRQDGLLGYFDKGKYATFNAIHVPDADSKQPPSGYLKAIGPGNYVNIGFSAKARPGTPAPLILIMDPRASVHAQCGFLPVKDVTLLPEWTDAALANIAVTFRTGPVLAGTQQVVPKGAKDPVTGLLWPNPAEANGKWSWVENAGSGTWREMPLAPVDALAKFPEVAPTLREGLLKLSGGFKE